MTMNRPSSQIIDLPIGSEPDWERIGESESNLKTIPESCVILHSLRRSREKWLSSTFPRFSTKTRGGKASEFAPPPHTIQARGKCNLEIGPHTFPETVFYEVHYLPVQTHTTSISPYAYQPPGTVSGSWQSTTPYGSYVPYTHGSSVSGTFPPPAPPEGSSTSILDRTESTPLMSSLTAVTTITPALINQVNSAASSNPILANLLQLAAAGKASPEQLKTLGLLIQSLATPEPALSQPSPPVPQNRSHVILPTPLTTARPFTPSVSPGKEFDLVFEFRETPSERWIFPRGLATCERSENGGSIVDTIQHIIIEASVPFEVPAAIPVTGTSKDDTPLLSHDNSVTKFHLRNVPLTVWDTLVRWAGGEEKTKRNRKILNAVDSTSRAYLGYRLPPGLLLSQVQAAVVPTYSMKVCKAGPQGQNRTKRRIIQRKADTDEHHGTQFTLPSTKRRRTAQGAKPSAPTQIQCISCKQADVPLIRGGRFCRPCVENGSGTHHKTPLNNQNAETAGNASEAGSILSMPQYLPSSVDIPKHDNLLELVR